MPLTMARQMARCNQDRVKTQFEFGMLGMRHKPGLRGIDDARLLAWRDREGGVIQRGAGLDLDKSQQIAAFGDDVDLAMRRAKALCENPVALGMR